MRSFLLVIRMTLLNQHCQNGQNTPRERITFTCVKLAYSAEKAQEIIHVLIQRYRYDKTSVILDFKFEFVLIEKCFSFDAKIRRLSSFTLDANKILVNMNHNSH